MLVDILWERCTAYPLTIANVKKDLPTKSRANKDNQNDQPKRSFLLILSLKQGLFFGCSQ